MFVPRAVRLKSVKGASRQKAANLAENKEGSKDGASSKETIDTAMGETSADSPLAQHKIATNTAAPTRGPRFTTNPVNPEYLAQLAAGIELIFTDYAIQEEERSQWLRDRYRVVDGEAKYVHLSAIMEHPNFVNLKPDATQILLKQALHTNPSKILMLSHNEYYVRRKPSTYPLPFVPAKSFDVVNDDGLSFWDERTIYVEPHQRNMCITPARIAQWLADHGELKPKWTPVQAVHTLWNGCAFVVLSGNVMHEDTWDKWRDLGKPEGWKILTKVEHTKRTAEYVALLEKENPRRKRRATENQSHLPPIARSAALPMSFKPLPEVEPVNDNTKTDGEGRRKKKPRTRRKAAKPSECSGDDIGQTEHAVTQDAVPKSDAEMPDLPEATQPANREQPTNKKKRKRRKNGRPDNTADDVEDDVADTEARNNSSQRRR